MSTERAKKQLEQMKLLFDSNASENLTYAEMAKFIRDTIGVTQSDMAKKLQLGFSTYQQWEYSDSKPALEAAANLCFLYIQCLYITKDSSLPKEIKTFFDFLLTQDSSTKQKSKEIETLCA